MGIEGQFSPEMHLRLFAGQNPHTGDRLPGMRASANRQGGWDITFNQEKWLSTLEHVVGDDRIGEIRHKARDKAMAYLETEIRVAVRKKSQLEGPRIKGWKYPERISGNIVWAAFSHPAGRDGNPHGHDHVVVYNESWDAVEGQWKTAVTRHIDKKAMEKASEIYHKEQARLLRKIGYDVKREGNRLYLPGFPRDVSETFTERGPAIKDRVKGYEEKAGKPMSSKARQKVGLFHRPEKDATVPLEDRRRGWLGRLSNGQLSGLHGMVDKARAAVSRLKVRQSIQRHLSRTKEIVSHEISHEKGRTR